MEHSNMEETRGIEYQIKASSETTIGSGCDGSNGIDDARNDDRSNEESHRQSSVQNINFYVQRLKFILELCHI